MSSFPKATRESLPVSEASQHLALCTNVLEGRFCELRLHLILGSSLSSDAAQGCLRICHEVPEDGIRDAPLEAPQRFLAGLALRDLLAVVGATPGVRPGLEYRY